MFAISFHPPFVWLFIIFATSLSGFFWILFPMFSLFFVVIVFMSSSPVSMHSVSVGVDWGTISTRRMICSCIRFSDFCSFLFIFQLSPPFGNSENLLLPFGGGKCPKSWELLFTTAM